MEKRTLKNSSKGLKITIFVLFFLAFSLMFATCVSTCSTDTKKPELDYSVKWDSLTDQQRDEWLTRYLDESTHNIDVSITYSEYAVMLIKKQLAFPETADIDPYPALINAVKGEPYLGYAFINGTVTAKNAFGVPLKMRYQVRFKFTSEVQRIDDVRVY